MTRTPTSPEPMNEDAFWLIIDEAREGAATDEAFLERAGGLLEGLEPDEILAFRATLNGVVRRAYRWDLWGAAVVVNGGCPDDAFESFRAWVVSLGRKAYEAALASPESLAEHVPPDPAWEGELEEFLYLPVYVYEQKTGEELPLPEVVGGFQEPAGERLDAEDLPERYPELHRRARERFDAS